MIPSRSHSDANLPDEAFNRIDSFDSLARWFLESGNYPRSIGFLNKKKRCGETTARETIHQSLVDTWKHFDRLKVRGPAGVFSYVITAAKNSLSGGPRPISAFAEKFDPPEPESSRTSPSARMEGAERDAEVHDALDQLSPRDRKVVRQYFVENRSAEEVATEMDLTPENVRKICQRARQILREILVDRDR